MNILLRGVEDLATATIFQWCIEEENNASR